MPKVEIRFRAIVRHKYFTVLKRTHSSRIHVQIRIEFLQRDQQGRGSCLSKHPMLAAAIPFPSEETTPPVTKIYLAMLVGHHESFEQPRYPFPILRRIHAERFILRFDHSNLEPVFESPQLLQPLRLLQRPHRQI